MEYNATTAREEVMFIQQGGQQNENHPNSALIILFKIVRVEGDFLFFLSFRVRSKVDE